MPINVVHLPNLGTLGAAYKRAAIQIATPIRGSGGSGGGGGGGGGRGGVSSGPSRGGDYAAELAAEAANNQSFREARSREAALNEANSLRNQNQKNLEYFQRWGAPGTSPSNGNPEYIVNPYVKNTSPYFDALDSIMGDLFG